MKAGLAETNITPAFGQHIPGYFHLRPADGLKDELFAKALAIETGDMALIFVVLDLISIEAEPVRNIRSLIAEQTGVPVEQVMVSCTHTHTGPPRPLTDEARQYYAALLEPKAAQAAVLAYRRRVPARIGAGAGREDSIAFNRRFYMKNGTVRTNPGVGNPEIVKPEGPIDPELTVLRIDDENGKPLGVVTNYACHTDTVKGTEYSADYPAYISETIKKLLGDDVVSLFMQGASGNINHIDVSGRLRSSAADHFKRMGRILGLEAARVREKISLVSSSSSDDSGSCGMRRRLLEVGPRTPTDDEIVAAREVIAELGHIPVEQMTPAQSHRFLIASRVVEAKEQPAPPRDIEIQVCAFGEIGEIAIVALPSEMFVEFGLEIKAKSPFAHTLINELANGSGNGYIAVRNAYERGGYETSLHHYALCSGERFTATAIELLHELHGQLHPTDAQ